MAAQRQQAQKRGSCRQAGSGSVSMTHMSRSYTIYNDTRNTFSLVPGGGDNMRKRDEQKRGRRENRQPRAAHSVSTVQADPPWRYGVGDRCAVSCWPRNGDEAGSCRRRETTGHARERECVSGAGEADGAREVQQQEAILTCSHTARSPRRTQQCQMDGKVPGCRGCVERIREMNSSAAFCRARHDEATPNSWEILFCSCRLG